MRIRVVLCGIVAAAACILALRFPWYIVYPTNVAPDWYYLEFARGLPIWLETGVLIFCGFTLFTFGWVAARWTWAGNWRDSLLSGAGAGLIAGCLIYDFIGAFYYGLLGQENVLKAYSAQLTETKGMTLLIDAIASSAYYLYSNFLIVVVSCGVLCGVGGLASAFDVGDVWGSSPRNPEGWLFRLTAYTLSVNGAVWTIVALAAVMVLQDSVTDIVIKNNLSGLSTMPVFITFTVYMVGLAMTLFPLSITWGWTIRSWRSAGLWRALYALWVVATFLMTAPIFVNFIRNGSVFFDFPINGIALPYDWIFTFLALVAGLAVGLLSPPTIAPDSRYRASDLLGYALAQGILGGTQIFISIPAYAFVLTLITIENIPHLLQTGIVEKSPTQQIVFLFKLMTSTVEFSMLVCLLGGLLFAAIISLIRKFLKIAPVTPAQGVPVLHG